MLTTEWPPPQRCARWSPPMTAKSSSARMLRVMLAFAASVSCHDYVPISMPSIDTAATASMIPYYRDRRRRRFRFRFSAPLDPVPVMPVFSRPAHVRAYALAFSCPLDVGVQEGPHPSADRASDSGPLPRLWRPTRSPSVPRHPKPAIHTHGIASSTTQLNLHRLGGRSPSPSARGQSVQALRIECRSGATSVCRRPRAPRTLN